MADPTLTKILVALVVALAVAGVFSVLYASGTIGAKYACKTSTVAKTTLSTTTLSSLDNNNY